MLRVDIESTSSSPFHAFHDVRRFFNNIWPSFDRKGRHRSKPEAPEVIDVPLRQGDGIRLYALFFYLSWFQKKQKLPTTSWVMNKSETLGIHYRVSQVYSLLLDGLLDEVYFVA